MKNATVYVENKAIGNVTDATVGYVAGTNSEMHGCHTVGEAPVPEIYFSDELKEKVITNKDIENVLRLCNIAFNEGFGSKDEEKSVNKLKQLI